ncbi:MAG: phosphatidate cytidylyltransferase [Anaerolineaceae bacterium]|nr:phosphatidate cytidylyltransferase [Anaerolineaceae bacterium]
MLLTRVKTAFVLLALGLSAIYLSGWAYFSFITIILLLAAREYSQIYHKGGFKPNTLIILSTVLGLSLFRFFFEFKYSDIILALSFLISMAVHTFQYEAGRDRAPIDFALTLGAIVYFGWIGSYFISIMFLPDGQWWLLLSIAVIAFADSGAYFIGSRFGKHKMAPRVSPKKSWEGYFGGVLLGILGGILTGLTFHQFIPSINLLHGLILGVVLSIVTPLGDLGESMMKRQFNLKDSSNLFPGHGGAMDRIDTWVWAVCISYYLIIWIF